jgi:hypothetical protein
MPTAAGPPARRLTAGSVLIAPGHRHPYEALRDGAHVSTMWGVGGDIGAVAARVKRRGRLKANVGQAWGLVEKRQCAHRFSILAFDAAANHLY